MEQKILLPSQRLVVAADFMPEDPADVEHASQWMANQAVGLANELEGTGVCLKVESAMRGGNYDLLQRIRRRGLEPFADLKLYGTRYALEQEGLKLKRYSPAVLTVSCASGIEAMSALKEKLPDTEVLGVMVLSTLGREEVRRIHGGSIEYAIIMLGELAQEAGLDGLIVAGAEVKHAHYHFGKKLSIYATDIRDHGAEITGDDQNLDRSATLAEVLRAGAKRGIVGRPITRLKHAVKRREEVLKLIDQIDATMAPIEL